MVARIDAPGMSHDFVDELLSKRSENSPRAPGDDRPLTN
jgi:hypothetical protein